LSNELDDDGFSTSDSTPVLATPHRVSVPKFFEGCVDRDDAIRKMISALQEPAAIEMHGWDVMYRRLADALILVLSIQGDYAP
jgi:hypothetical protein